MTRSSKGTKLDVSAVGSEHQKRTAPRAVGAWCRLHGFHGSPLCVKESERQGSNWGGATICYCLDRGSIWGKTEGRPSPDPRDALVLSGDCCPCPTVWDCSPTEIAGVFQPQSLGSLGGLSALIPRASHR